MTVKTLNNKVVLVGGKVSCLCCAREEEFIPCDSGASVSGGQGAVFAYRVFLGPGTGFVTFSYEPFVIPDRFVVLLEGNTVLDTGYTGDNSSDNAAALAAALGQETPIIQMTTPLGDPEVRLFEKVVTTNFATVLVYAPLDGTGWNWQMSCVGEAP